MKKNVLLLILMMLFLTSAGHCNNKHVLILHSYHPGYIWTDNLNKALLENLQQDGEDRHIAVEYLDAMKNSSPNYLDLYDKVLREKYLNQNFKIDLIIVSDDNALKFLDSRPTLFGTTPIVFCGINNFERKNFPNLQNFTGVNESISLVETISLALKNRSHATKMAVIAGTSLTAQRNLEIFKENAPGFEDKVKISYLVNLEPDVLVKELSQFSEQDIIVYLSYLKTPKGKHFTVSESLSLIKNASKAAIFSFWDFLIPDGAIGGKVVHAESQAEAAAELALRVLKGTPANTIPVEMESPNRYVFNGKLLDNYKINTDSLPRNTIVVNRSSKSFIGEWDHTKINSFFGYDLFAKHGSIMMLLDSLTGIILDANKTAHDFYGYNNLIGKNISDINTMPAEEMKIAMTKAKKLKQNHFDFLHRIADGTLKNVEVNSYPVEIMGTKVLFSIINDVTDSVNAERRLDRINLTIFSIILLFLIIQSALIFLLHNKNNRLVRAEEKIKNINIALEAKVSERTADLQIANRELESFSYSVSHDLRAPLRAIEGFSAALYEDYYEQIDATGRDYLQRVRNAANHMSQLIDDFLNLSRITRKELELVEVDLSAIASEIANNLKQPETKRRIELTIQPDLKVNADTGMLKILLNQLFTNAFKFTTGKDPAIIKFGKINKNGSDYFCIEDNGAGFDQNYADKLFTPFQRLHTVKEFPGTGIGLAIAQRIISKHGGDIFAEGKTDNGAKFYFKI